MLTPERERELAEHVVRDIIAIRGTSFIPYINEDAVAMRLQDLLGFEGLVRHDQAEPCRRIAALARTAIVTVTIPSDTEES